MVDRRNDVHELLAAMGQVPREVVPALLTRLAARLAEPDDASAPEAPPSPPAEAINYLTAQEAAQIARVEPRVIYGWSRRADWRLFSRRLSRKVLRIEEQGFQRWLNRQTR